MRTDTNLIHKQSRSTRMAAAALTAALLVPAAPTWSDMTRSASTTIQSPAEVDLASHRYPGMGGGRDHDGRYGGRVCRELEDRRGGGRYSHGGAYDRGESYDRGAGRGGYPGRGDDAVEIYVAKSIGAVARRTTTLLSDVLRLGMDCAGTTIKEIRLYAESNGRIPSVGIVKAGRLVAASQSVPARAYRPLVFSLGFRGEEVGAGLRALALETQGLVYISKAEVVVADVNNGGPGHGGRLPFVYTTSARVFGAERVIGTTGLVGGGLHRSEHLVREEVSDLRAIKLSARDDAFNVTRLTLVFNNGQQMDVAVGLIGENRDIYVVTDDDDRGGRGRGLYNRELRLRSVIVEGGQGRLFGTRSRLNLSIITDTDEQGRRPGHGNDGRDRRP